MGQIAAVSTRTMEPSRVGPSTLIALGCLGLTVAFIVGLAGVSTGFALGSRFSVMGIGGVALGLPLLVAGVLWWRRQEKPPSSRQGPRGHDRRRLRRRRVM